MAAAPEAKLRRKSFINGSKSKPGNATTQSWGNSKSGCRILNIFEVQYFWYKNNIHFRKFENLIFVRVRLPIVRKT